MAEDHWPTLHQDPYALARLKKSCQLLNAKPGMSVLDVGCHQGEARQFLKDCEYMGIDTLTGHEIDGGFDMGRKFDGIICLEVLEHLKYPQKTLKSITEHLSDDGIAVISLPNEATLFHRIRSFLGTPDQEAFSENGKHLHLPNLNQSRNFVASKLQMLSLHPYINLSGAGSRQQGLIKLLVKLIPIQLFEFLTTLFPSLFARGFIFVCKNK